MVDPAVLWPAVALVLGLFAIFAAHDVLARPRARETELAARIAALEARPQLVEQTRRLEDLERKVTDISLSMGIRPVRN